MSQPSTTRVFKNLGFSGGLLRPDPTHLRGARTLALCAMGLRPANALHLGRFARKPLHVWAAPPTHCNGCAP